jgi:catechol 2,3-dioxygenase-like lactoylglutathione lyase family enzyme
MERVTGIGGIFFKAKDPKALGAWYEQHLGLQLGWDTGAQLRWDGSGATIWSPFKEDTQYFAPSRASFMVNFRVVDLDRMLAQLRAAGVEVDEKTEASEFGKFGWCMDPEGNRVELWQPPPGQ